jgi:DNA repair protein SbcC/Rad50
MKLRFYNFKCYEAEEFTIPDQGLVLISAPSGSGKSTILEGIIFALFGTGKKLPTWGKKSCKVELEYKELFITRTKVPNRLVVKKDEKIYEDDVGQEIINRIFGEIFQTTSFVDNYNLHKSFILMSPIDKLIFLEKFAFHDVDLVSIKEKTKEQIKLRTQTLRDTQSKLETTKEILTHFPELIKIDFPLKKVGKTSETKMFHNETVRHKNTKILIERTEKKLQTIEIKAQKFQIFQERKSKLENEIKNLTKEIEDMTRKQGTLDCLEDEEIKNLEIKLKNLSINRERINLERNITSLEENFKQAAKQEKNEWIAGIKELRKKTEQDPKEIGNLLANLYQQKSKAIEYEKLEKEYKEYEDISDEDIETFQHELQRNIKELENKQEIFKNRERSKVILNCPNCKVFLNLKHEPLTLVIFNNESQMGINPPDINELEAEIEQIKKNIDYIRKTIIEDSKKAENKKVLETKLNKLKEFFTSQNVGKINLKELDERIQKNNTLLITLNGDIDKLQDLESKLRNDCFSVGTMTMKKELEKLLNEKEKLSLCEGVKTEDLELLENFIENNETENQIQAKITEQKVLCKEYDLLQERIEGSKEKLAIRIKELEKITQGLENITSESLMEELENSKKQIINLKNKLNIHEENLGKIEEYKRYIQEKQKRDTLENKLRDLETDEKEAQENLTAAELFKQKILESESIAIHNVINSINLYAENYLELFFPDDPIIVTLSPFKEAKNKKSEKPQINLQIIYKNEECDITSLSGGEMSRLVLAFTLALGEMFNTPALLLDECTASLDQNNTQNVFESIKMNFKNRLVLAVAHQVVEGSYDYVIEL